MRKLEIFLPALLFVAAVGISAIYIYIATQRTLTGLEGVLLQAFALIFGLAGSFLVGKRAARDAARDIVKPHARSAFRRLVSLYESLSRVGNEIEAVRANDSGSNAEIAIARLEAIVIEQLSTADDALEDWRDIVPEDVEELRQRFVGSQSKRSQYD